MAKLTSVRVRECDCDGAPYQTLTPTRNALIVDESRGVVKNVKVVGLYGKGRNRHYPLSVLREALPMYEGVRVNFDHVQAMDGSRPYKDRFGRLRNVRITDDGIYGDLHFNPKHAEAPAFVWFAKHDPNAIGLSHDARVNEIAQPDGSLLVRKILRVVCVDIVADPSTTHGLQESLTMDELNKPLGDDMTTPTDALTDLPTDLPPEPETDDDGDDVEALITLVGSILRKPGDMNAKIKRVVAHLKAHASDAPAMAQEDDEDPANDGDGEGAPNYPALATESANDPLGVVLRRLDAIESRLSQTRPAPGKAAKTAVSVARESVPAKTPAPDVKDFVRAVLAS